MSETPNHETGHSSLDRLAAEFAKLPGIGRKSAEKLAYHLLRASREEALSLSQAIRDVKEKVFACSVCAHLTESDPCGICTGAERDRARLCVVEQPRDVISFEKTASYDGLYHVLTGRVAPLEGVGAEDLTIPALRQRIRFSHGERDEAGPVPREMLQRVHGDVAVAEVVLATNPDFEGDGTALYLREALESLPVRVTQLARGLPQGANIEFVSTAILADALRARRDVGSEGGTAGG